MRVQFDSQQIDKGIESNRELKDKKWRVMVQFQPFAGWRYDMSQVGSLGDVVCSVPEEILLNHNSEKLVDDLYRLHPCNAVRLVLNRSEPGDQAASDRIARIVDFFQLWKREEIVFQEHDAAFYVVEQSWPNEADLSPCISVVGRLACEDFNTSFADGLSSSELVFAGSDAVAAAGIQFAPIQALVTEHEADVTAGELFHSIIPRLHGITPIEIYEDSGQRLRVWVVTDRKLADEIRQRLVSSQITVVSGQATLLNVMRAQEQRRPGQQPFAMVWMTDLEDPGLRILPSVALVSCPLLQDKRGESQFAALVERLSAACRVELVGDESFAAADALELAEIHEQQPACCLGLKSGQWALVTFRNPVSAGVPGFTIENAQADLLRHICEVLSGSSGNSVTLRPLVCDRPITTSETLAQSLSGLLRAAADQSVVVAMPDSLRILQNRRGRIGTERAVLQQGGQRERTLSPAGKAGVVYYSVDE